MSATPAGDRLPAGPRRILLVSHEASRTGAPRIALLSARSLAASGHSVRLVSRVRGPLLADFAAAVPTSVEPLPRVRNRLRSRRATRGLATIVETLTALAMLVRWRPDLVYVNSTAAAVYLRPARWLRRRTLLHVHESGELAERFLSAVRASVGGTRLVACSPSVQTELAALLGTSSETVALLPSVPDGRTVRRLAGADPERSYAVEEVIVGCCGTVEHRKGVDLWAAIAADVKRALPERRVRFVWVGDIAEPPSNAESPDLIEFTGPTNNPYAYMRRFDIATLPSRDDPFPLVVLEAMLLGKPVVAFDVGGVARQVGDGGIIVPPRDVVAFAEAVIRLITNPEERRRLGEAAQARAQEHYSTESYTKALKALIES